MVAALVARPPDPRLVERLATAPELRAPHVIDLEVLHALRRMVARDELTVHRAADARSDFADLLLIRHPHPPLADRIWALRDNLSAYDAAYVALAEALGVPLITCDARLAGAPSTAAHIEVYAPDVDAG